MDYRRTIAQMLLQIGAIALRPDEPFVWTSGRKSPIYCDNRLTLSFPDVREVIAEAFRDRILTDYGHLDVVAGVATGAIVHAALVAQKLSLPMVYVRSSAKGHGKQNQVEGKITPGQRVLIVEDLISTGGSCLEAVRAVEAVGGDIAGVSAIFSYGLEVGTMAFAQAGLTYTTLTDFATLLDVARTEGFIDGRQLTLLEGWIRNPDAYGA